MSEKEQRKYNVKKEQKVISAHFDILKWIVICSLLIGGIVANSYFGYVAWPVRTAIGIVVLLIMAGIITQTAVGQSLVDFSKGAKIEMRKVVWPTRQETIQTTLVVVGMVVFSALVLWGMDTVFFWLVGLLAGQRS